MMAVLRSSHRYTKVGFAGNLEPSFVVPSVVAVRQSPSNSLPFTPRNSSAGFRLGSWTGLSAGFSAEKSEQTQAVLADLDYRCGQEAIAASRSASHVLVQPINKGQVGAVMPCSECCYRRGMDGTFELQIKFWSSSSGLDCDVGVLPEQQKAVFGTAAGECRQSCACNL